MSTILHRLAAWAESEPNAVAQSYKKNGKWISLTSKEYQDRVHWMALFFESRGMIAQDVGTIFSYNCPEWVHMDLAAVLLGAKSAGIYPNSTPKDILYILEHTESRFFAVQNKEYFSRIQESDGKSLVPDTIQTLIVFDGDTSFSPKAISYEKALAEGKRLASSPKSKKFEDYLKKLDPKAGAFMIYTSGTTGRPKGAVLSLDNITYTMDLATRHWQLTSGGGGKLFSFLPLCHIAEKIQNIGAGISLRYSVSYCTKFENLSIELPEVKPTLLLCVPRLWEKMMEGVEAKIEKSPEFRKKLARWAMSVGGRMTAARQAQRSPGLIDFVQWQVADRLVISKVRAALGLSEAVALASGAAVLPVHVYKWFGMLGLEIMEVFGQTESTGAICLTPKGLDCSGSVGKAVEGIEFKIADDGEILTRGRHVFIGYYKDDAATAAVLEGGWLHTGDLGEFDSRGLVRIKGRKKEILKTSGGKMVAPVPIEEALKASPCISQVCMVGDGKKYLSALITLSQQKLEEIQASGNGLQETVITSPQVVSEVKKCIDELNASLASYEQIKRFAILSREFSINEGEMTPTLKMKRNVIETRYRDVIDQLYA